MKPQKGKCIAEFHQEERATHVVTVLDIIGLWYMM